MIALYSRTETTTGLTLIIYAVRQSYGDGVLRGFRFTNPQVHMFRTALIQVSRSSPRHISLASSRVFNQHYFLHFVRGKTDDARKARLEHRHDLQRDWDARILTYAEVKPKTLSPTPVKHSLFTLIYFFLTFMFSRRAHI